MKSVQLFTIILFTLLIYGCGSGGNSSSTSQSNNPPPVNSSDWIAQKPQYTGLRSLYPINAKNSSETVYSTLQSIDLILSFTFGADNNDYYFLASDAKDINLSSDNTTCESGSATPKVVEENKRIEVNFNHCVVGSEEANGQVRLIAENGIIKTAILSINLTDKKNGNTSSVNGYFSYSQSKKVTFNMLFDDGKNQVYFDDFTITLRSDLNENGIEYSGDIYISDEGKISISTPVVSLYSQDKSASLKSSQIKIVGTISLNINVTRQELLNYQYSSEYLDVVIPLNGSNEIQFDGKNSSPIASIEVTPEVDRKEQDALSAKQSNDPEYNPLTYKWTLISQPQGSNIKLFQTPEQLFSSDIPGKYTIRLTVTDPFGKSSFTDKTIQVLKNAPEGNVVVSSEQYIDTPISANVDLQNDQLDGPFEYYIKFGPANMTIDQYGHISWDGALPDYGQNINVNYAIYVKNSDRSTIISGSLDMMSQRKPIVRYTALQPPIYFNNIVTSDNGKLYMLDGGIRQIVTSKETLSIKYQHDIKPNSDGKIKYSDVSDINHDGIDDFWYSAINMDTNQIQIFWRDGKTGTNKLYKTVSDIAPVDFGFQVIDYNLDGQKEISISDFSKSTSKIYDLQGNLLYSINYAEKIAKTCKIDNKGTLAIWALDGRLYSPDSGNQLSNVPTTYSYINADGSNSCQYLSSDGNGHATYTNMTTQTTSVIFDYSSFNDPTIQSSTFTIGDFDGDGRDEALIMALDTPHSADMVSRVFIVNDIATNHPTSEEVIGGLGTYISTRGSIGVFDLNADGQDEVVYKDRYNGTISSGIDGEKWKIVALDLNGNSFSSVYQYEYFNADLKLFGWSTNNDVYLKSNSISIPASIAKVDDSGYTSYYSIPNLNSFDAELSNDQVSIYGAGYNASYLSKFDISGSEIWQADVQQDDTQGIDKIDILSNGLIFVHHGTKNNIISPNDGSITYTSIHEPVENKNPISYSDKNGNTYIVDMDSHQLLRSDINNSITLISNNEINNLLDSGIYKYSFFNSLNHPELVIYSIDGTYKVVNLDSETVMPSSPLYGNKLEHIDNFMKEVLPCFKWDKQCRNLISLNGTNGFKVVDKFSGNVIWSSPNISSQLGSTYFRRDGNHISTAIVEKDAGYLTVFQ